ncbi:MAG: hypothetical protein KatS3mg057_3248 [Herpetosiphonaceae bacterium]|nr:MAG: hypothetical protein KatS3mg057_3248 [Herpetosiphonaceae bacterium]
MIYDVIVIGAGPCGLSTAIAAREAGLTALVLEKGAVVNTIVGYPLDTRFFSTAGNLEIGGIPFITTHPHPTRDEALAYYRRVVSHFQLEVRQYEEVVAISGTAASGFTLETRHAGRPPGHTNRYRTRAVVFASGSYDSPNRLGVPGEELAKVHHYFREGHPFFDQHVAVIGGGNSAAEAALSLFYAGAHVTLVHFLDDFDPRVKPWVLADLRAWIDAGRIKTRWRRRVQEITPASVVLINEETGEREELANDWVFAMIGYRPDTRLLQSLGVTVDPETLVPTHDPETMETNIRNVFIAGVLAAGALPSKVFIENGRYHGPRIVQALVDRINRQP